MFNFPLTKSLQQRKTARHCKTDEKQYCQYWILRLVVFTRFPASRDCLLKLYMLLRSATVEQCFVSFTEKNVSTLRLLHMVD